MKNKKLLIIILFLLVGMNVFLIGGVSATPNINVDVNPEQPTALGNVTFTVNITNMENVDIVVIHVQECASEVCFMDFINETMLDMGNNTYQKSITLVHDNAVRMDYYVGILSNNSWTWTQSVTVNLNTSSELEETNDVSIFTYSLIVATISVIFIIFYILYRARGK
jgi:hypothetical protein